jgi:hypothetical protein
MFEYVLLTCAVFTLNGDTSNPCFGEKSSERFPSYYSCRAAADRRVKEVLITMQENFPQAAPVATAVCGEETST